VGAFARLLFLGSAEEAVPVQYLHEGRLYAGRIVAQRYDQATGEHWLRFIGQAAEKAEVGAVFTLN